MKTKREIKNEDDECAPPSKLKRCSTPTPTSSHGKEGKISPPKIKGDGEAKTNPWRKEEDAVIMRGVNKLIANYQPSYAPMISELRGEPGRSKNAIQLRWNKVLKPRLLQLTSEGSLKVEK